MKLGNHQRDNIRHKIMKELYGKEEDEFDKEKTEIIKKSRDLYIEKVQPIIDKLPNTLIAKQSEYTLSIKYKSPNHEKYKGLQQWVNTHYSEGYYYGNTVKDTYSVEEEWTHNYEKSIINPSKDGGYNAALSKIEPELKEECAALYNQLDEARSKHETY